MTVKELIEKLEQIPDKSSHVAIEMFFKGQTYHSYAVNVFDDVDSKTVYIND